MQETKNCPRCGLFFPATPKYFYRGNVRKRLASYCKKCSAEASLMYNRKRQFGLEQEDLDRMLSEQNNRCGICGREQPETGSHRYKSLAVDHDHRTGKVRGLLCNNCNRGLGLFGDSPDTLRKAAVYLEENS